jgi:hypothetical protein
MKDVIALLANRIITGGIYAIFYAFRIDSKLLARRNEPLSVNEKELFNSILDRIK